MEAEGHRGWGGETGHTFTDLCPRTGLECVSKIASSDCEAYEALRNTSRAYTLGSVIMDMSLTMPGISSFLDYRCSKSGNLHLSHS